MSLTVRAYSGGLRLSFLGTQVSVFLEFEIFNLFTFSENTQSNTQFEKEVFLSKLALFEKVSKSDENHCTPLSKLNIIRYFQPVKLKTSTQ